jgi:hypothetical protein
VIFVYVFLHRFYQDLRGATSAQKVILTELNTDIYFEPVLVLGKLSNSDYWRADNIIFRAREGVKNFFRKSYRL